MFAAWFEYIINSGRSIERGLIGWVLDIMKYYYERFKIQCNSDWIG